MNAALQRTVWRFAWPAGGRCRAVVRWRFALAALLVAWQTLGLLHAVGHLSDPGGPDSPGLPQHGAACVLCLAHAGGDGALLVKAPALPSTIAASQLAAIAVVASFSAQSRLPYQVRAPPLALA